MGAALPRVDQRRLRRVALQQQGLLRPQAFGRGRKAVLRALLRLGYVQIDTISVVERAHHHVLRSRVPNFVPSQLQKLVAAGDVFEYWSHAAAFLPMRDYRFSLPRKQAFRRGENHWGRSRDKKLMADILARIEAEGPLKSRDFEQAGKGGGGWWEWKPAKQALEQLFMQGDLMVYAREGFQKTYDLPGRVLPQSVDTTMPDTREYAAHLVDTTLQAQGFTSMASISYLRKGAPLRQAIRSELDERLDRGELLAVQLAEGAVFYGLPELLESAPARATKRVHILSPFDNALIQRDRTRQLFDFDYQVECYLPQDKRRYGYFALPLLYGAEFIGRMDCKAHRGTGTFEIRALHLEQGLRPDGTLAAALTGAIREFAAFNGCETVRLEFCPDRLFARELGLALQAPHRLCAALR
jgi:uncharacterized protein YcaQ